MEGNAHPNVEEGGESNCSGYPPSGTLGNPVKTKKPAKGWDFLFYVHRCGILLGSLLYSRFKLERQISLTIPDPLTLRYLSVSGFEPAAHPEVSKEARQALGNWHFINGVC
jgi:hypothetical protein